MLTIHGVGRSRAFRCIWAAEEAGMPYEHVPTPVGPEAKAPAHLAINPNGKLPGMTDGALNLFESLAINLYIANKAGAPLMPEAGDDAARTLQWTLWTATEAEPHAMAWRNHAVSLPAAERDPAVAEAAKAALHQRLAVLEAQLADRPWLLGRDFTVADCNLAGVLYVLWFNRFDLGAFPRVAAWLEACLTRPAALKARRLRED